VLGGECTLFSCKPESCYVMVFVPADHLKMPARIRAGDGTFDTFVSKFVLINLSGLGHINVQELASYLTTLSVSGGSTCSSSAAGSGGASRVSTAASSVGKEYPSRSPATASS